MTIIRAIKRDDLEAIAGLGRPYLLTRSAVLSWALGERGDDGVAPRAKPDGPTRGAPAAADSDTLRISEAALIRRRSMAPKRRAV